MARKLYCEQNFIIDEEAAPVVRQIYNLCLAGNGPTKASGRLQSPDELGASPPGE